MFDIAVVSGGRSAERLLDKEMKFEVVIAINAGIFVCDNLRSDQFIYAARDELMLRLYKNDLSGKEVWSCPRNKDLITYLGGHYTTDISPETIGYSFTATATLFQVYNQFRFADNVCLYGFDMIDGAALSSTSSEGESRWQQERKEFSDILSQFDAGGLGYQVMK